MRLYALLFSLLLCTLQSSLSQSPDKLRIRLNFGAGAEGLNVAKSYISRELRALGDVEITDRSPALILNVFVDPLGKIEPDSELFVLVINLCRPVTDSSEPNAVVQIGMHIDGGLTSDLDRKCKVSIAKLDSSWLDQWRKR